MELAQPAVRLAWQAVRLAQPAERALKVGGGWPSRLYGGGPCDFSVSPKSPFTSILGTLFDFWVQGQDLD